MQGGVFASMWRFSWGPQEERVRALQLLARHLPLSLLHIGRSLGCTSAAARRCCPANSACRKRRQPCFCLQAPADLQSGASLPASFLTPPGRCFRTRMAVRHQKRAIFLLGCLSGASMRWNVFSMTRTIPGKRQQQHSNWKTCSRWCISAHTLTPPQQSLGIKAHTNPTGASSTASL